MLGYLCRVCDTCGIRVGKWRSDVDGLWKTAPVELGPEVGAKNRRAGGDAGG